jgi:hypothetical protein
VILIYLGTAKLCLSGAYSFCTVKNEDGDGEDDGKPHSHHIAPQT